MLAPARTLRDALATLSTFFYGYAGQLDRKTISATADQVFTQRASHAFPPITKIDPAWGRELEVVARELVMRGASVHLCELDR